MSKSAAAGAHAAPSSSDAKYAMMPFVRELVRPYAGGLGIVFAAMLVETLMSLAAPWPLKIVLDDALGHHQLPHWLSGRDYGFGRHTIGVALFAGAATIVIAVIGASRPTRQLLHGKASASMSRTTWCIRLWSPALALARVRPRAGTLLSTITNDVATVQDFASASTLGILVDLMTIVGMLGLMFWLNWDFTLIAVAVTPFLLLFVMRFKKAVKEVQREVRKRQSDVVAVVQQGLGSIRVVEAFGRQDLEAGRMTAASRATVTAALRRAASRRCSRRS
jgi:subfamily B ATP-binding cassette protein MsbA